MKLIILCLFVIGEWIEKVTLALGGFRPKQPGQRLRAELWRSRGQQRPKVRRWLPVRRAPGCAAATHVGGGQEPNAIATANLLAEPAAEAQQQLLPQSVVREQRRWLHRAHRPRGPRGERATAQRHGQPFVQLLLPCRANRVDGVQCRDHAGADAQRHAQAQSQG